MDAKIELILPFRSRRRIFAQTWCDLVSKSKPFKITTNTQESSFTAVMQGAPSRPETNILNFNKGIFQESSIKLPYHI